MISHLAALRSSRTPGWVYLVTLLPSCAIVALFALQPWIPFPELVRDAMEVVRDCIQRADTVIQARGCASVSAGLLSNLGILLWSASAAICLFGFLQVYHASGRIGSGMFLLYAGLLTGALLIDDMFMGHEIFYPNYLGLDQRITVAIYAGAFAVYLVLFRGDLLKNDPKILLVSLLFFAFSQGMEELFGFGGVIEKNSILHRVIEDGFKFIGIWGWAVFHFRAAWLTRERLGVGPAKPAA